MLLGNQFNCYNYSMQHELWNLTFRFRNCNRRNRNNCITFITAMLTNFVSRSESRKLPCKLRTQTEPDLSTSPVTFPLETAVQFKPSFTFYHVISDRRVQITQSNICQTSHVRPRQSLNLPSRCSGGYSIVKIMQSSLYILNFRKWNICIRHNFREKIIKFGEF